MYHVLQMFIYLYLYFKHSFKPSNYYKQTIQENVETKSSFIPYPTAKKPSWVKDEIMHIKAMMPELSTRVVACIFNSKYEDVSVGKSYVTYTLSNHKYEIEVLRKKLKNKAPHKVKFNNTWGIDLTFLNEVPHLGVIEHHSRKVLELIPLQQKRSVDILFALLQILKHYPKPKSIRSDNEACFTSKLMSVSLKFLGITHQTIDPHSPWQNGRIERFFGTFKSTLKLLPKVETKELYYLSYSFKHWYNTIRPHMSLDYETPDAIYYQQIKKLYQKQRSDE